MADGHLNKCKLCARKDGNKRYYSEDGRKKVILYEQKRNKDPIRKAKRIEYQRKGRAKNPGKYKAHSMVNNAVRDGRLKREPCEVCGKLKVEAHHDDYRSPLKVRWLCRKHHLEVEGKLKY